MGDTYMQKLKKALDAGFSQGEAMFLADVLKPAVLTFDRDCFLNWRIMVSLWGALLNFEPVMYERVFGFCFEELLGKLSHLPMPSRAALLVCVKFGFCREQPDGRETWAKALCAGHTEEKEKSTAEGIEHIVRDLTGGIDGASARNRSTNGLVCLYVNGSSLQSDTRR